MFEVFVLTNNRSHECRVRLASGKLISSIRYFWLNRVELFYVLRRLLLLAETRAEGTRCRKAGGGPLPMARQPANLVRLGVRHLVENHSVDRGRQAGGLSYENAFVP